MKVYQFNCPIHQPHEIFSAFANQPYALLLDSSRNDDQNNLSIICFDPVEIFEFKASEPNSKPFEQLQALLDKYRPSNADEFTHFIGGLAGLFSYDLGRSIETLPSQAKDELNLPDIAVGLYLKTLIFNHETQNLSFFVTANTEAEAQKVFEGLELTRDTSTYQSSELEWTPDKDKETYKQDIQKTINYIYAGDIFQACIAQRFTTKLPKDFDSYAHYSHLRTISPAPYGCYMNIGQAIISSNSPEQFLKLESNGKVETNPIKGTAPIHTDPEHLLNSEKDRSENTMIVDLLRNDLSKTCEINSINVKELCALKSYANVHHLVSKVTGQLKETNTPLDLLRSCFPGGSITGAPKIRAMEIIDEIEPIRRNTYCGSIGTIGFNNTMSMNILIRTLIFKDNTAHLYSGGGIVAESDPEKEYQETIAKAQKLFESF